MAQCVSLGATVMNPLLTLSAHRLARLIRHREVTAREVVEAHIAHARRVNPVLNAIVQERYARARAEADAADARTLALPAETLPPLHGVPCTIKESFQLEGMPHSAGLLARREVRATGNAITVARLRAAGAIPLGVTNVSELCMWMESNNRVYGRTNNPYDPRCIVGGSSGGEGAIVGAGASPFGLGSDVGGSIRMPAFFNGVFGHKPTGGMVPGSGQYPVAEGEASRMLATGPITRRAEDLMPLLRLLAGPDGQDAGATEWPLGDPASVEIASLTVLDVQDNGVVRVSDDLRAAQRRCAEHLARRGATVRRVSIAGLARSFDIWTTMLSEASSTSFASLLASGGRFRAAPELVRWALRRSPHTLPAIALATFEALPWVSDARLRRLMEQGRALREELVAQIGPTGVMLYPSYSRPAPRHYRPLLTPFDWIYTAIFNAMQMPVTQVPLGLNGSGLPLGVQVAAVHGNDHVTVALALELERAFGGWVPPPRWFH
jgi:fatty acid amide hydrolase 2